MVVAEGRRLVIPVAMLAEWAVATAAADLAKTAVLLRTRAEAMPAAGAMRAAAVATPAAADAETTPISLERMPGVAGAVAMAVVGLAAAMLTTTRLPQAEAAGAAAVGGGTAIRSSTE